MPQSTASCFYVKGEYITSGEIIEGNEKELPKTNLPAVLFACVLCFYLLLLLGGGEGGGRIGLV